VKSAKPATSSIDVTTLYLRSLNSQVLTRDEEKTLALAMRRGDEPDATRLEKRDAKRAYDMFVAHNLRLVVAIAKQKLPTTHPDFLDAVQQGNQGLLRAIDKFDPTKGFKFSTYATWWIRVAIDKRQDVLLKTPAATVALNRFVLATAQDLAEKTGRQPSLDELHASVKERGSSTKQKGGKIVPLTKEKVLKALELSQGTVSFDSPRRDGDEALETLHETLPAPEPSYVAEVEPYFGSGASRPNRDLTTLEYLMGFLTPAEQYVIHCSYEVGPHQQLSTAEIRHRVNTVTDVAGDGLQYGHNQILAMKNTALTVMTAIGNVIDEFTPLEMMIAESSIMTLDEPNLRGLTNTVNDWSTTQFTKAQINALRSNLVERLTGAAQAIRAELPPIERTKPRTSRRNDPAAITALVDTLLTGEVSLDRPDPEIARAVGKVLTQPERFKKHEPLLVTFVRDHLKRGGQTTNLDPIAKELKRSTTYGARVITKALAKHQPALQWVA
jgi:RNA polymerase sigma factor (sigma-70 family)